MRMAWATGIGLMTLAAWGTAHGEEAALWTWHDPGAYQACIAAGGDLDHHNVTRHGTTEGPWGHPVVWEGLFVDAGGLWWIDRSGRTGTTSEDPADPTAFEDLMDTHVTFGAPTRVRFDPPVDLDGFIDQPWRVHNPPHMHIWAKAGPFEAWWSVPECALDGSGEGLDRFEPGARIWVGAGDQVQMQLDADVHAGDALAAASVLPWEPAFHGLQPVTWMGRALDDAPAP